jgi:proline iminopeptidase
MLFLTERKYMPAGKMTFFRKQGIALFLFGFGMIGPACAQTEGMAQSNGAAIYYRTFGSGTPVLIINGGPGLDSEGFIPLAELLSGHNQTIIFDQRGTGKSTLPKLDSITVSMDLMVEDIENLREQLHIRQWILFGHSFGGMLASYYTALHPEHVISLILSSSGGIDLQMLTSVQGRLNARLTPRQRDSVAYWSGKISQGDTSYSARWGRASALANAYLVDKRNVSLVAERLMHSNLLVNSLVFGDMQRMHFDCSARLSGFTKPVLIIQGKEDIVDEKIARKAHQVMKNSRILLLDHCSHYGWLDRKEEYLSEVLNFLLVTGGQAGA